SVFEREETTVYERGEGSMPSYPPTAASGITSPGAYGSSPLPYTSYLPPPQSPLPNPGLVPPPAMSRTGTFSAPPPAIGRISSGPTSTATFAPPTLSPPTIDLNQVNVPSPFGARAGNRNWMVYAGVAAMVAIALIFVATGRRGGKVAVFAASASGKPLAKMAVYVDGVQKCSASPCTLDLDKGIHYIKASADGYSAQGEGTTVRAGDEFALNFKLDRSSAGTGLKVTGRQDGVELFVDGKSIGPLPQEVKDLAPGPHQIGFKGSDRYAPEERTISVDTDEIKDMGSVSLRVLRGLASFDVRTPGVKVTLVSGKDRRQLTDFSQPVEIETSKSWTIEATKPGYDDFRQPITFEDRAEKTFVIVLQEHIGAQPVAAAPAPAPAPRPQPQPAPALQAAINPSNDSDTSSDDSAPNRAAATGSCTLNLNSIPVSNVLLDGRPIGGTPRVGVTTTAGTHNILFVGPEGRKLQTVSCRAGETKAVGVRLTP
ncbi:MAG TPA: PEGA domain-containing protein, partial [Polyangiaceae bacterium]